MIISHSNKFVYIRSQKTGSTSIQKFLLQYCNETDFLYISRKQNEYKKYNVKIISTDHLGDHASVDYVLDKFSEVKDYKFITSVRHPFDVEISFESITSNKKYLIKKLANLFGIKLSDKSIYKIIDKLDNIPRDKYNEYLLTSRHIQSNSAYTHDLKNLADECISYLNEIKNNKKYKELFV